MMTFLSSLRNLSRAAGDAVPCCVGSTSSNLSKCPARNDSEEELDRLKGREYVE